MCSLDQANWSLRTSILWRFDLERDLAGFPLTWKVRKSQGK